VAGGWWLVAGGWWLVAGGWSFYNPKSSPTVSEKTTGGTDKAYALQKMLHQTPTRYLNVP
jgi:hypothetical protein